jgi:hypothetical protein
MGPSQLSAAWALIAAGAVAAPSLCGQGPVYRERWGYLHLENRRFELLQALRAAEASAAARAADRLAEPDGGVPFAAVARALASLRGVAADDRFLLRSMLSTYVLPEVADPDGAQEVCRRTNVSLFLPFAMPLPPEIAFELEVRDAAGDRIWSVRFGEDPTLEDLRMARLAVPVPAGEFADGSYRLRLLTLFGGAAPGPDDPVLEWPCHVLRGYQARCEAAFAAVGERVAALGDEQRALLLGLAAPVQRAYGGEAFDGTSDAVVDLLRLEQALQNLAADRHVLSGLVGDVPVYLASAGARGLAAVLRLPADFAPGQRRGRPLVVFAAAAPAYDQSPRRPTAPVARSPRWTALELATFGQGSGCDVAFLESPGERRDYVAELQAGLVALRQVLGVDDAPLLLVCDGEAASIAAFHAARLAGHVSGLVLIGAGAISGQVLDALGALPVRMQPLRGSRSSEGMQRSLDYVLARTAAGAWRGDVERLAAREVPWPLALPLLQPELEAFALRLAGR